MACRHRDSTACIQGGVWFPVGVLYEWRVVDRWCRACGAVRTVANDATATYRWLRPTGQRGKDGA